MYRINITKEFGRGLYATKAIRSEATIAECELLVLSPDDTKKVNETDLKYYTFKYNANQDCLVLGDGELFNHSDTPNVRYRLYYHNDRLVMLFEALRFIVEGEQLFIDYGADTKVDVSQYKNKNLVG